MRDVIFEFTPETAEKFFHLRLQNEWLFKKKKQPWKDFYNLLLDNGFPKSLTMAQMRKKWDYTFDAYKEAKQKNNKSWIYYKIFDKYLGKIISLDKYESWNVEWRLKLIKAYRACHAASEEKNVHTQQFWKAVEKQLRSDGLPTECCIQDIQGLFHRIKVTFERKLKVISRRGSASVTWPLYGSMLELYEYCEPESLQRLRERGKSASSLHKPRTHWHLTDTDEPFVWSKDMTESFIQIRLQHEWLFKERKQPWAEFTKIMQDNGYNITHRVVQRKWHSIIREYQKALASNNTNWVYYNLFQLYLGEHVHNLDPLHNWQEYWIYELIKSRTRHHQLFCELESSPFMAWREVEKNLRELEIPLDHSLLDIQELWKNLKKTYSWKCKFAAKGLLTELWPYYDAMEKYFEAENKETVASTVPVTFNPEDTVDMDDGFDEEDIKPLCYVSKVEIPVEIAVESSGDGVCRACGATAAGARAHMWGEGGLAHMFGAIAGVEVQESDGLPDRICSACNKQLEAAYQFRLKCQNTDKQHRLARVKVERMAVEDYDYHHDFDDPKIEDDGDAKVTIKIENKKAAKVKKLVKPKVPKTEGPKVKKRYIYRRICEICGKNVLNMREHMIAHTGLHFTCHVCSKSFRYNSGLLTHMLTHSDKTVKDCSVCGKSFKMMCQYRRHFAHHADERKYVCETCGKSFNSKDILVVHTRMHTNERPYGCPECGKRFRTTGCVSRHRRIVHKIAALTNKPKTFRLSV